MFTDIEFAKLDSIWDGKLSNTAEVCNGCGACCHNSEKTLFPGEYEYAFKMTGQRNTNWCSVGCLCMTEKYKPIICKVFPLFADVTMDSFKIDFDFKESSYSKNCLALIYTEEDRKKANEYFEYFLSDRDNRIFYMLTFCLANHETAEKEKLDELKSDYTKRDLLNRAIHRMFGFDLKYIFESYKF